MFRACAWVVVLSCKTLRTVDLSADLDALFTWMPQVTRNEASDGLNQVIDAVCNSKQSGSNQKFS